MMSDRTPPGEAPSEGSPRDEIRLLLRVARAGVQCGWAVSLRDVWAHAATMARAAGVSEHSIREIRDNSGYPAERSDG